MEELSAEQQKFQDQTNDYNQAVEMRNQLENKIAMLSTEIERFQYKLNSRTNEVDTLKKENLEFKEQLN